MSSFAHLGFSHSTQMREGARRNSYEIHTISTQPTLRLVTHSLLVRCATYCVTIVYTSLQAHTGAFVPTSTYICGYLLSLIYLCIYTIYFYGCTLATGAAGAGAGVYICLVWWLGNFSFLLCKCLHSRSSDVPNIPASHPLSTSPRSFTAHCSGVHCACASMQQPQCLGAFICVIIYADN